MERSQQKQDKGTKARILERIMELNAQNRDRGTGKD
jgi:hypothetical protein